MTAYSFAQLESIWLQAAAGTSYNTNAWAALMAAIALAESSGNPDATNPTDNGGTQTSWGLWQISLGNHNAPAPNWNDPIENARLAIGKLQTQGLSAWGTYTSGAYQKYMQGNVPPANANTTGSGSGTGAANATTTSFNPLSFVLGPVDPAFKWFGKLITGTEGIPATVGDVATAITGLVRGVTKLTQLFLMLFRPDFWLRVLAFIVGLLSVGAGLYFLKEAL